MQHRTFLEAMPLKLLNYSNWTDKRTPLSLEPGRLTLTIQLHIKVMVACQKILARHLLMAHTHIE
jgi:hypothetical protein